MLNTDKSKEKYIIKILTEDHIIYLQKYQNNDMEFNTDIQVAYRFSDIAKSRNVANKIFKLAQDINILKITIQEV